MRGLEIFKDFCIIDISLLKFKKFTPFFSRIIITIVKIDHKWEEFNGLFLVIFYKNQASTKDMIFN
jgi:hypothetical protein